MRPRPVIIAAVLSLLSLAAVAGPAPLAGRWEGVFHGGRGDQPVTFVCRPGAGGTLRGLFYMGGDLMGPLENGSVSGDSLHFTVMNFGFAGRRQDEQMAVTLSIAHGRTHELALHFTSPDTAALVRSAADATAARAKLDVAWGTVPESVYAAHRLAADAPAGVTDALRQGTFLLVGGGPTQDDVNAEFVRLAGGAKARIVVIPTAAEEPGQRTDPAVAASAPAWARSLGVPSVTVMHTFDRKVADSDAFVKPLLDATGVWLPGGEAGRILVSYLGTRTERELLALLARGGVIAGTSAGALVWGSEVQTFRAPADGSPFVTGDSTQLKLDDPHAVGFGVLRQVVVAPHFTEFRMQPSLMKTIAAHPQLLGIGIDEATALEVRGNAARVLGRGHVTIVSRGSGSALSRQTLSAGDHYDLVKREALRRGDWVE